MIVGVTFRRPEKQVLRPMSSTSSLPPEARRPARKAFRIGGDRGGQYLERDVVTEPCIVRAIDIAHATGAEGRQDLIATDALTRGEVHGEAGSYSGEAITGPKVYPESFVCDGTCTRRAAARTPRRPPPGAERPSSLTAMPSPR